MAVNNQDKPHIRPETPTRALLKRVQRRSSAGGSKATPPPLPLTSKRIAAASLKKQSLASTSGREDDQRNAADEMGMDVAEDEDEGNSRKGLLDRRLEQLQDDLDGRDMQIASLEAQLHEVLESRGDSKTSKLTRAAAAKLEREFASQEFILQGLQKDNEKKTIECERLRRENKIMIDHCIRQYGEEDWEAIVFGSSAVALKTAESQRSIKLPAPVSPPLSPTAPTQTVQALLRKPPMSPKKRLFATRLAKSSDGGRTAAEASFYSADETAAEHSYPSSSSPPPTIRTPGLDLISILKIIDSQKTLIRTFEKRNAAMVADYQERLKEARERELVYEKKLALHQYTHEAR